MVGVGLASTLLALTPAAKAQVWYPYYGWYPYPAYPYPYPYAPPPPVAPLPPTQAAAAPDYWYHCDDPKGYYPHVTSCPGGWHEVLAAPSTSTVTPTTPHRGR